MPLVTSAIAELVHHTEVVPGTSLGHWGTERFHVHFVIRLNIEIKSQNTKEMIKFE